MKTHDYSKITHFIAYDPGGKTGYAICSVNKAINELRIEEFGEFPAWEKIESQLSRRNIEEFCVVYESFTVLITNVCTAPMEVIGVIKFLTDKKQIQRYSQKPNERKCVDKIFPEITSSIVSHGGDAVRHAVYFAMFRLGMVDMTILLTGNRKKFRKSYPTP